MISLKWFFSDVVDESDHSNLWSDISATQGFRACARLPSAVLSRKQNCLCILCKHNPEVSQADLNDLDSWDKLFKLTRTKSFRFSVFRFKVSALDSELITFRICDESGNFSYRIHVCV